MSDKHETTAHCKGSWALGTACGRCVRCTATMQDAVKAIRSLRERLGEQSSVAERVKHTLRCFPLPSQSASSEENYRRMLEWLYRDSTDRLICDLVLEDAHG